MDAKQHNPMESNLGQVRYTEVVTLLPPGLSDIGKSLAILRGKATLIPE